MFFFCKLKTAYVMRISDWSSDVCSFDLPARQSGLCLGGKDDGWLTRRRTKFHVFCPLKSRKPPGGLGLRAASFLLMDRTILHDEREIGRASCRERVLQYV